MTNESIGSNVSSSLEDKSVSPMFDDNKISSFYKKFKKVARNISAGVVVFSSLLNPIYATGLTEAYKRITENNYSSVVNNAISGDVVEDSLDTVVEEKRVIPEEEMDWDIEKILNKYGNDLELYLNSNFVISNGNGLYKMNEEGNIDFYTDHYYKWSEKDDISKIKGEQVKTCTFIIDEYLNDALISVKTSYGGKEQKGLIGSQISPYRDGRYELSYYPDGCVGYKELMSRGRTGECVFQDKGRIINPKDDDVIAFEESIGKNYIIDSVTGFVYDNDNSRKIGYIAPSRVLVN